MVGIKIFNRNLATSLVSCDVVKWKIDIMEIIS